MEQLSGLLNHLTERHRAALLWFAERSGEEVRWPGPLEDGTKLATRAKGIYKPVWSKYALSVRQSIDSPYPDRDPLIRTDGTWAYFYFQENIDPNSRDLSFTNRGLLACQEEHVPVAVMRQVKVKPYMAYGILGLALVVGWSEGYFIFEGFSPDGQARGFGSAQEFGLLTLSTEAEKSEITPIQSISDERERILASIVRRRGQPEFRQKLIEVYEGRCVITGCGAAEALEAAHIVPYSGPSSNNPSNGLLLRADIHTLFDLGLISVDAATMCVLVSPALSEPHYQELCGKPLRLPKDKSYVASKFALGQHRTWSGL